MDCHDIPQKHKKHLKMGIDLHHGMDSTGQIPEGTVPPNAHDFYDDGHHSAKAHGEHTGGGTAGNCKPDMYQGKLAPFHRHPGADYCHAVSQKHGGSSTNKLIAQQWHNTHQAQLQESWYLFNESQGIEQEEAIPDPYEAGDDHVEELVEEEAQAQETFDDIFVDQVESPGSVANPHNASVNDIITLKEDYFVDHPAKTYIIQNTYEEDGILAANIEHTETGHEHAIPLDDENIESVEHWQPEGDPVDPNNPHEFTLGSTFTTQQGYTLIITSIDIPGNKIFYTQTDPQGENPEEMSYALDEFNNWVTGWNFKVNPPNVPDGFQHLAVGDTIGSHNIKNLNVGAVVLHVFSDSTPGLSGKIIDIDSDDEFKIEWSNDIGETHTSTWTQTDVIDSNLELVEHASSDSPDTYDQFYTEDAVGKIPKVGTTLDSPEMLASIPPGTTLVGSKSGVTIQVTGNSEQMGQSGIIEGTMEGINDTQKFAYSVLLEEDYEGWAVQSLPDVASFVKNKGWQLGGKVTKDNWNNIPVGLSFILANGNTATVTQTPEGEEGLQATIETKDGLVYKDVQFDGWDEFSDQGDMFDNGLKVVGLPDGTVVQHVPEPTGVTPINKHGLDKGTTVTIKEPSGYSNSAKIIKTHKTKMGQNYTLEYTDGINAGKTVKIASNSIKDAGIAVEDSYGVFVDEPTYKPGQEPTDGEELTLPPLFSEPGNWDEVLEQVEGSKNLGYTAGGTFTHKQTGQTFYIKFPSSGNDEHMKSEDLANRLYELLGVGTLGTSLIDFQGKTAVKSTWDPDLKTINLSDMSKESGIMDNFVIDAWLANWDVIGPNHDNIQKSGGQIVKVDSGGALGFHGAGSPKGFPDEVVELETMRDPDIGKVAHQVFGDISEKNLIKGAQKLAKVTDAQIDAIVNASQISNKSKIAATLKARRDNLVQKVLSKDLKQGSDWTQSIGKPGQHQHEGYPGWHSETLKHPPSNKTANAAHKKLGLPHQVPRLGVTSIPATKFWARFGNSAASKDTPKIGEVGQKALAMDWKGTDTANATRTLLTQFFTDNGITDTFKHAISQWQGGENLFPRAKINAAYAVLTSANSAELIKAQGEQSGYFIGTRNWSGSTGSWQQAWKEGTEEAIALLPYLAASQQGIKRLTTQANPDHISVLHRGLKGNVASLLKKGLSDAASTGVENIFLEGGLQGWSTNLETSENFAGGSGVVLSKKKVPIDDILLYFPTWESHYSKEEEIGLDPNAFVAFSPNEINVM